MKYDKCMTKIYIFAMSKTSAYGRISFSHTFNTEK